MSRISSRAASASSGASCARSMVLIRALKIASWCGSSPRTGAVCDGRRASAAPAAWRSCGPRWAGDAGARSPRRGIGGRPPARDVCRLPDWRRIRGAGAAATLLRACSGRVRRLAARSGPDVHACRTRASPATPSPQQLAESGVEQARAGRLRSGRPVQACASSAKPSAAFEPACTSAIIWPLLAAVPNSCGRTG